MREKSWKVGGVEVDRRLLKSLRQKWPGAPVVDSLNLVPERGSWGVCSMIDSLYLVENPLSTLVQVRNVLAPGGYVFIRITNRNWLIRLMSCYTKSTDNSLVSSALTHFSKRSIEYLLNQAGFKNTTWIYWERNRKHKSLAHWLFYNVFPMLSWVTFGHLNLAPGIVVYAQKKRSSKGT